MRFSSSCRRKVPHTYLASSPRCVNSNYTGVDPTTGPTTMQLFQLLSNAEFRKAGKKLKEELEKAGVDLGDQVS